MHYCIITGGPLKDEALSVIGEGVVFCADSGTDFARIHNIIPDRVFGDLDSISVKGLDYIREKTIPVEEFPVEKDWTDTEIILDRIPEGSDITIVCPLQTDRIDHVIGNIQIAAGYASKHERIVIADGFTRVYLMNGRDSIRVDVAHEDDLAVSLIPLSFDSFVKGVRTVGLYYRLDGDDLAAGKTFSFCNHPEKDASDFTVSIESGRLAVIVTKDA